MNDKTKLSEEKHMPKRTSLGLITVICAAVACSLIGIEFFRHFSFNNNAPIENWVTTATYLNNAFSPVLLFASIFLLYRTWSDSKEALELQKRELEATKEVLKEQSDTQNFTVIKDAVFDIADKVKSSLQKKYAYGRIGDEWILVSESTSGFKTAFPINSSGEEIKNIIKLEDFLHQYFIFSSKKPIESTRYNNSLKGLILSAPTLQYIDKVKSIALFMKALKSDEFKEVLEITLFAKLTIFTWLMFVEIAYHLLKTAKEGEQDIAELVFIEIAGLTCRQLKAVAWLNALSDEVLAKLKERKLL
ncbi:hypothetical protein D0907_08360 [Pseudoalteromonas lipolytica]|uniref:Uncharacterized protein n=1 Tax=Pseudoalteromonas lipolytica TaxID=570156 RepID=A0AAD0RZ60_9GAMM|nr:hypothetical protein [Pseudoalteromonas donghaensis]AXV65280.1 hypothetical protein D0907_08360 [Pseudoalteromonas donghaensis]